MPGAQTSRLRKVRDKSLTNGTCEAGRPERRQEG